MRHFFFLFLLFFSHLLGNDLPIHLQGRILFLLQQGKHIQALEIYKENYQVTGQHHFELLHQMALRILADGFRQNDPESQLYTLFGANIAAHEEAYFIIEESLKSCYPPIQLVAVRALAQFQTDRADQAILRALGTSSLEVRFEAAHQLCKKKHPLAVSQTESLFYKTPSVYHPLFPPLFAMVEDEHSTRILRKLFNHSSSSVRLAVILSVAKYHRDDLLTQLRQQATELHYAMQEGCAATFAALKDEKAIPILEKLAQSQYESVSLSAHMALFKLGKNESLTIIKKLAKEGNLFAISILGSLADDSPLLLELIENPRQEIRLNAFLALLEQHRLESLPLINEIVIRDKRDWAYRANSSPGQVFKAWKIIPSATKILKEDIEAYAEHIEFKESILEKVRFLSPSAFITLADQIFAQQQNELIPKTVLLLQDIESSEAIACLKRHQQQLGAPLVRQYCNLTLLRMQEPGPYGDQLRQWLKAESKTQLIQLKPCDPWKLNEKKHVLTPEETSRLLIEAFETFASKQDALGVEILIDAIANGNAKNKYALAGLLLRASQ